MFEFKSDDVIAKDILEDIYPLTLIDEVTGIYLDKCSLNRHGYMTGRVNITVEVREITQKVSDICFGIFYKYRENGKYAVLIAQGEVEDYESCVQLASFVLEYGV